MHTLETLLEDYRKTPHPDDVAFVCGVVAAANWLAGLKEGEWGHKLDGLVAEIGDYESTARAWEEAQAPAPGEKRPRLCYWEDSTDCWSLVPFKHEEIPGIFSVEQLTEDGEEEVIRVKRLDMTDAEVAAMPED